MLERKPKKHLKVKVIDSEHANYGLSIAMMLGLRTSIGMINGKLAAEGKIIGLTLMILWLWRSTLFDQRLESYVGNVCTVIVTQVNTRLCIYAGGENTPPHDL